MSNAPVVIINLAGQLSALQATSFKSLSDDVQYAYGSFITNPENELVLSYTWQGVRLDVKSDQSLQTFLALFQQGAVDKPSRPVSAGRSRSTGGSDSSANATLPTLDLIQRKRITSIPTLDEMEAENLRAEGQSDDQVVATTNGGGRSGGGPRKAARVDTNDTPPPPEAPSTGRPTSASGIYNDTSASPGDDSPLGAASAYSARPSRPNSATARELLDSFRQPRDPEPESIRIVMRDGSSSTMMPYNSTYPPPIAQMRQFAWTFFGERLEDRVAEIRGTPEGREAERRLGAPIDPKKFLMGFWFEGCDLPIDIDDREDEVLLKRAVEQFGLRDVILYVDVPFVELQPVTADIITESIPALSPRGLQVNLTRLPARDKVKQTVRQQQLQLSQLRDTIKAHQTEVATLSR